MRNIKLIIIMCIMTILGISMVFATDCSMSNVVASKDSDNLILTAVSPDAKWGASIEATAIGGCTFPDGSTEYKSVMLSTDGSSKSIKINGVSDSCRITGDYKFGTCSIISFNTITIDGTSSTPVTPTGNYDTNTLYIIGGVLFVFIMLMFLKKR